MEIGPINRVLSAPVVSTPASTDDPAAERQVVMAVQGLNKSEMMGTARELAYRRDPKSQRIIVQIVDKASGEVVDQIPPESVVRMMEELKRQLAPKET